MGSFVDVKDLKHWIVYEWEKCSIWVDRSYVLPDHKQKGKEETNRPEEVGLEHSLVLFWLEVWEEIPGSEEAQWWMRLLGFRQLVGPILSYRLLLSLIWTSSRTNGILMLSQWQKPHMKGKAKPGLSMPYLKRTWHIPSPTSSALPAFVKFLFNPCCIVTQYISANLTPALLHGCYYHFTVKKRVMRLSLY